MSYWFGRNSQSGESSHDDRTPGEEPLRQSTSQELGNDDDDRPGRDSFRHRLMGVGVSSQRRRQSIEGNPFETPPVASTNYHSMQDPPTMTYGTGGGGHDYDDPLRVPSASSTTATSQQSADASNEHPNTTDDDTNDHPSPPFHQRRRNTGNKGIAQDDRSYRGFSTSIGDMFTHPQHERVDCCALTCCGIFQSDRDRYLLLGIVPPSPWKRLWVHLLLPLAFFLMAGYAALNVPDPYWNQLLSLAFLILLLGGIFEQCAKGRAKRMAIRKDVLWTKYQVLRQQRQQSDDEHDDCYHSYDDDHDHDHHRYNNDNCWDHPRPPDDNRGLVPDYFMGQTRWDIGCSHPYGFLLGCYPSDRVVDQGQAAGDNNQYQASFCSCLYNSCCFPCCGCHLQVAGICGMAQESREIEHAVVPPHQRRFDYITMQPMMEYYPAIYQHRWKRILEHERLNQATLAIVTVDPEQVAPQGPMEHMVTTTKRPPLSRLSYQLIVAFVVLTVFLAVWSIVGPFFWTHFLRGEGRRHFFGPLDFVAYLLTWLICMAMLALMVHLAQRPKPLEISVDAMIKYFACGFALSTTLSIFWELVIGLVMHLGMLLFMTLSGINGVQENSYSSMVGVFASSTLPFMGFGDFLPNNYSSNNWFNSSSTKVSGTGYRDYLSRMGRDRPIVYSLYLFLSSYVVAAMVEEICKYFGYRMLEHPDFMSQEDLEQAALARTATTEDDEAEDDKYDNGGNKSERPKGFSAKHGNRRRPRRLDFSRQAKSLQAQGAAITVAMVCVAMGFSVCEDLVYIFLYNGSSVSMEFYILLARTVFPIHPIAAAIQSLGVCERDLEHAPKRFGRILLPAVLFHGTYDFLLLWIEFLFTLKGNPNEGYRENDAMEVSASVVISYIVIAIFVLGTLLWYKRASTRQRERLAAQDSAGPTKVIETTIV